MRLVRVSNHPHDAPPSEELPADPDGSLRAASEAATAKALGLDLEGHRGADAASGEARERRRALHAIAATRATQVPKRESTKTPSARPV